MRPEPLRTIALGGREHVPSGGGSRLEGIPVGKEYKVSSAGPACFSPQMQEEEREKKDERDENS